MDRQIELPCLYVAQKTLRTNSYFSATIPVVNEVAKFTSALTTVKV